MRHRSRGAVGFLVIADKWQVLSVATLALSQLEATLKPCRLIQWSWLPNSDLMAALVAMGLRVCGQRRVARAGLGRLADAAKGLQARHPSRASLLGPVGGAA